MQNRCLPAKIWAAALPTLLTHQGFESMLARSNSNHITSQASDLYFTYSQLERFLGTTLMRRNFHRTIEENVYSLSVE